MCGWNHSAVAYVEMEQSKQTVHVVCLQEVRSPQIQVKPTGHRDSGVSTRDTAVHGNVFGHLHVHLVSVRVEVKHYRLLHEAVLRVHLSSNLIEVLVNGLLNVQSIVSYQVDMVFDEVQSIHPLLHLPVAPHALNAVSSSLLNDLVYWQLLSASSPQPCFEGIFNGCLSCHSFEQSFKEEDHLLVFLNVDFTIVV